MSYSEGTSIYGFGCLSIAWLKIVLFGLKYAAGCGENKPSAPNVLGPFAVPFSFGPIVESEGKPPLLIALDCVPALKPIAAAEIPIPCMPDPLGGICGNCDWIAPASGEDASVPGPA